MILKVSKSGAETGFMCQTTCTIPTTSKGVSLLSIDLPSNAGEYSPPFTTGVTVNGNVIDMPAQGSLDDLVKYLNGIDAPNRALFLYLHDGELEICAGEYAVVFSAAFVAYLGLASVNLAANSCVNVTLHLEQMEPVSEYVVKVSAPILGAFNEQFTQEIGYVKSSSGKPAEDVFFPFSVTPPSIHVAVYYRAKDTGDLHIASCDSGDRWSVCLRI